MKDLRVMFALCLGIMAFFLWAAQRVDSLGSLPYLLLLLCLLVHLWTHRGHGKGGSNMQGLRGREQSWRNWLGKR